jgi:hypothetical protein
VTKQVVVTYTCDSCEAKGASDDPKYLPWYWSTFWMKSNNWIGGRQGPYVFYACEACSKGARVSIFRLLFARLARGK